MGITLFQPNAPPAPNTPVLPVAASTPELPDVFNCAKWYSTPTKPLLSDCIVAFRDQLPSGSVPTAWYTASAPGEQRNVLPLSVHHGTCEILFHTSGQSAETQNPTWIVPDDIRTMASWVLGRCTQREGKGGMLTKGLKNTIDSITSSGQTMFPDPALPPSSSFYSLHVWNWVGGGDPYWNPGNNDPTVGSAIDDALNAAVKAAPDGSPERTELERRAEYLWSAVGAMRYGENEDRINWWAGPAPRTLASTGPSASNESVTTA